MPAIMDDPDAATIYRVSGAPPYPDPQNPLLPANVVPRHVTLRDRQTVATVVPFASRTQVPPSLLLYLSDQFRKEIEGGDTYPMIDPMPFEKFASYWFQNFGAIMLLGHIDRSEDVVEGRDWSKECLGSFYIKPNYPGRSSHVCNAGFLVTDASRNRGVGRLMGESYLEWAPKLGYTYSVFNLVYETNVASCKIWDGLGFKRIGRVKGCGNLKSYPGRLVDAIIYGRDLVQGADADDLVSDDRFDKIKYYLKYGEYPNGADRAEKSRLRSAATTYKLLDGDVLMLKDKEVVSNPDRQFAIAREIHLQQHAGINKTTATIAERYHWTRIKDTVSDVIRNCTHCKEPAKIAASLPQNIPAAAAAAPPVSNPMSSSSVPSAGPAAAPTLLSSAISSGAATTSSTTASSSASASACTSASSSISPSSIATVVPSSTVPMEQDGRPSDESTHPHAHLHSHPHTSPQPPPPPPSAFAVTPDSYKGIRGPVSAMSIGQILRAPTESPIPPHAALPGHNPMLQDQPRGLHPAQHGSRHVLDAMLPLPNPHASVAFQPIDPKIISQPSPPGHPHHHQLQLHHQQLDHQATHHVVHNTHTVHTHPGLVQAHNPHHHQMNQPLSHHNPHSQHHGAVVHNVVHGDPFSTFHDADVHSPHHQMSQHHHHHAATDAFTSLLNAPDDDGIVSSDGGSGPGGSGGGGGGGQHHGGHAHDHNQMHGHQQHLAHQGVHDPRIDDDEAEREAAVDRDLDMLLEPQDEDEDETNAAISIAAAQLGSNSNACMHDSNDLRIPGNGVNIMNSDSGAGHRDADGLAVDDIMGAITMHNDDGHGQMHVHRAGHGNTSDNSGHLDVGSGNGGGGLDNNSSNVNNSAHSLRPGMDLEPDPDPMGAGINRFISKMDIGRLLSSEEAARDSVMGVGDSGMDDIGRRTAEDDRLDEMQFGGATG
ncbi:histone acetyltransferase [Grosmannia clavigera kw1407]|uniref:Histone acetyltransferase n=1 Tax=Grosmannia clavigera (strain kw1407 / UAMH 11150) TaxID=655863 RepID=F0XG08_GROCL|nr:histone acetyltransferase [Grosmannia clavigera kw1407]EFX03353.1 histone acetyltransferase [Grosmannia clavigera kw1407]